MKRILFILAIAVMVSSCFGPEWEPSGEDFFVRKFIYNGHSYIEFKDNSMYGQGYVHDPDCPCRHKATHELSEWQMLQLAIVYTESKFRPDVTGKNQDGGLYQITPTFVKEVNRIAGTDYTHEDVYDPDKAIEIFGKMQDAKNPGHDIDTAIYFHNKSANYRRVVLENLELIKRYETFRSKLIEKCSGE